MRFGNIYVLLIQLYLGNVFSLKLPELEFFEKTSALPAQFSWLLDEMSINQDDESVIMLKEILLAETLASGSDLHPHARLKRDIDEGVYRNFNITKMNKPIKSQLNLGQLDKNPCNDQVMSRVFELNGKSVFVLGNYLFLVDENLTVPQHKKLFSTDFHFSVRLTEGVVVNNELYFLQIVSTGKTPNTEAVNCEDLVYSRTYYALFRVKLNNNEFEIEELSDLDDDHEHSGDHVRAALAYIEEENRIVVVAFHHVVGKNLLDYLHFRIGQDDALVREGHQIKYPDTIHDLKLFTTVGSVKLNFMVLAKDETIELYYLVELPQNLLVQEIEIANIRSIEFFGNRWGNYLLAIDGEGLTTVFWFDGEQFIQIQSFSAGGTNVIVDNTFVDEQQMVIIGNEKGSVEFFQFVMPGVMRQVIPVEEITRPETKVSTLNLGRTVTQKGFKYFVGSLVRSSDGKFSFQTSLVEIGRVAPSRGEPQADDNTESTISSGPGGLVVRLEVALEEDDWLLKQAEESADGVIQLNETISIVDTCIDVVSSRLSNLSPELTIGILLDTFDGFDRIYDAYDSLSEITNITSTVKMSDNVVYKTTVFKTLQQKTYNVDGIIFESVLEMENAIARNANSERINGFNVDDALTKTLKIYEDQTIEIPFNFKDVKVGNTEINNFTNNVFKPSLLIDGSKENELSKPLTFKNIVLESDSVLDDSKINKINISDIIKKSDLDSSSNEDPVEISGDKGFNSVLEMKGILASEVNEKVWATWYNKVLFKEGQDLQVIVTKKVNLPTVNVVKLANIDMLDDMDVTFEVLNDIARTDETFTFKEDVVFNDINIKNFVANTVNHFTPESFLVDGKVQTISQKMSVSSLEASKIVHQNLLNGINLKLVATVPGPNEYASKVTFKNITVTELLDVKDGKTLDNVDVSLFRMLNAFSMGIIYINETLKINGTNIDRLTFGDFPHEAISEKNVREQFLFKNYDQEFPNFNEFDTLVNVTFKNLTIKKTLDNLKLDEVVHTSSNESINRSVTFTLLTSFMENVELTGDNSTIGGVDVPKLFNSTAYDFLNSNTNIIGKKTVSHVESQGNVQVNESFSHLTKDLETFSENLVRLNRPNTFTENVRFRSAELNKPSLSASTIETINVTANDEQQVEMNGKNLLNFVQQIVRNNDNDIDNVSSDVEFKELVNSIGRINYLGGLIDGENLVRYALKRILHIDTVIDRSIIVPNARFEKDINIIVDGYFSMATFRRELFDNYFSGEDLWEYVDKLYLKNSPKPSITGKKTLTGYLTVDGNLNVFDNLDNDNYAFNANLPLLEKEYLSRSKQQAVYLKYNFGSISGVETLDVPVVDGVNISNFCFINENCNIVLDGNSLEFTGNVVINDLEGQVRTGGTVFKEEFSSVFSHNLESLEDVEDIVWQNNGSISDLYENLVVKSDYDYRTNSRYECPESCQEISGMVIFDGEFEAKELLIEETSKINDGHLQNEVDLEFLNNDCAWMSKENTFTAIKEFNGNFSASAAKIGQLMDTHLINNVDLKQLRSDILVKESEVPSPDFAQIIKGTWFISNGLSAGDLKVGGVIDDIKVEDFVRKNHFESERSIPKIRFAQGFILSGNLDNNGSDIEKLFKNAILLDEDNENIQMDMNFTDNIQFSKDLKVDYIDEIPMHKAVQTNMDMSKQTIAGLKTVLASINVKTNIGHTFLNGLHMDDFNEDALRIDREETITLRNITFEREVKMSEVNIPGKEKVGLEVELLNAMKSFTEKLYNFYDEQVVNPLRHFLDEVAVGEMLSFGEVETMERQEAPQKYEVKANTEDVNTMRLNEAEWSFSSKVVELNDLDSNEVCLTTKSSYVSSVSDKTEINDVNAFMFTLKGGLWTVSSTNQRYEDGCTLPKDNQVIVTGLINTGKKDYLDVETMEEKIYVTDISNITGTRSTFGYIKDVVMWDVGNGLFLMAIACSFPKENIHILLFDQKWSYIQEISPSHYKAVSGLKNMHANIIEEMNDEDIQLIVTGQGYGQGEDKILFFSWNHTGESFALKQTIPSRHLSSLVLMNTQPMSYMRSHAMMIVASKIQYSKYEFITELLVYKFNNDTNVYDLDDHSHKIISRGVEIVQMKIKEISGYQILFVAETNQIKMLKFVPNQGFQLMSWAEIKGILDINLYEESLEMNEGGPGTTVMIHVTSKENGELTTTVLSAFVEGKLMSISKTLPYLPTPRTQTTRIVNGAYGPWSAWSTCSKSCGNDVAQFRTRLCNNPAPSVGGRTCKGSNREYQSCNQHPCPIDGSWSAWRKWSSCSATCGEKGVKTKTRTCNSPAPSEGGLPCAGKATLLEVCRDPCCPQEGGWSQWGAWTECYMACGVDSLGNKKRSRECNAPPRKCAGQECPGSNMEIITCEKECPERVEWQSWGEWGSCSRSCGGGVQKRFRECSSGDETGCVGSNAEHRVCEEGDCQFLAIGGGWTSFGACTKTCEGGLQTRTCTNPPPEIGGQHCIGATFQSCNEGVECPPAYPGVKIDFGEPGKNVQEGFLKLGNPDGFGATYTGTFQYEGKTAAIKISGHGYTRGNFGAVTNEFAYLSNLLRSSFLRNSAGTITVEISNLNPSTKYEIITYHHCTHVPGSGTEFTLEYAGNSVKTLKQSASRYSPDPPLIHTEIVTSNNEGKISFLMEKPDENGGSHMNLNGLEMSRAISGRR